MGSKYSVTGLSGAGLNLVHLDLRVYCVVVCTTCGSAVAEEGHNFFGGSV